MSQLQKFEREKKRAKGRVRLLRARGSAELRKVASGFATQSLWLRNGKLGSQEGGVDRSRFPGEEQLWKLGEKEDKEGEPATERRTEYTDLGLNLGKREEQVVSNASALDLAMADEARQEAEM